LTVDDVMIEKVI